MNNSWTAGGRRGRRSFWHITVLTSGCLSVIFLSTEKGKSTVLTVQLLQNFNKVFGSNVTQQKKLRICCLKTSSTGYLCSSLAAPAVVARLSCLVDTFMLSCIIWTAQAGVFRCFYFSAIRQIARLRKTLRLPVAAGQTNIYSDNKQCALWTVFCKPSSWATCASCSEQDEQISTPGSYSHTSTLAVCVIVKFTLWTSQFLNSFTLTPPPPPAHLAVAL